MPRHERRQPVTPAAPLLRLEIAALNEVAESLDLHLFHLLLELLHLLRIKLEILRVEVLAELFHLLLEFVHLLLVELEALALEAVTQLFSLPAQFLGFLWAYAEVLGSELLLQLLLELLHLLGSFVTVNSKLLRHLRRELRVKLSDQRAIAVEQVFQLGVAML